LYYQIITDKIKDMKRKAQAVWNGNIKNGNGSLTTDSTVLNKTQYSFNSRFADGIGTNPEELLAAAHAGCFTMKLSLDLTTAGFAVDTLATESTITLNDGKITQSLLVLNAKVPGISEEEFLKIAKGAEETCPVSQAFSFEIVLQANLIS
jgi:osmotically inducible protein OsmC